MIVLPYSPTVTNHSIPAGTEGSLFFISISFPQAILNTDLIQACLQVQFGSYRIEKPSIIGQQNSHQFNISFAVPEQSLTNPSYSFNRVSITLNFFDISASKQTLHVCDFTYKRANSTDLERSASPIPLETSSTITTSRGNSLNQRESISSDPATPYIENNTESKYTSSESLNFQNSSSPQSAELNQDKTIPAELSPIIQFSTSPQRLADLKNMASQSYQNTEQEHKQYFNNQQEGSLNSTGTMPNIPLSPIETPFAPLSSLHHHTSSTSSSTSFFDPSPNPNRDPKHMSPGVLNSQGHNVYYGASSQGYLGSYDNSASHSTNINDLTNWSLGSNVSSGSMTGFGFHSRGVPHQPQLLASHGQQQQQIPMQPVIYGQLDQSSLTAPQLVRTTALSQATMSLGMGTMGGLGPEHVINEATKASLEIRGNLDQMPQGWSHGETQARRRLVQFKRRQRGSVVVAEFMPLDPEKYTPLTPCISCILWEERNECFVTSVDCIYLLEQLINTKFTVEEKNRIRRNLEGYHPLTVSKGKANSNEFFKLIMSFSQPKPRNIEKDVKVFQWQLLGKALEKIVGKYSADYGGHVSNNYGYTGSSAMGVVAGNSNLGFHTPPQLQLQPPNQLMQMPHQQHVAQDQNSHQEMYYQYQQPRQHQHLRQSSLSSSLVGSHQSLPPPGGSGAYR